MRTFVDPTDPNRVSLFIEGATLPDFEDILKSEDAVNAMKHDGVHPDTGRVLEER